MQIEQHPCESPECQGANHDHRVSRVTVHSDGSKTLARECTVCGKLKISDLDPGSDFGQAVETRV